MDRRRSEPPPGERPGDVCCADPPSTCPARSRSPTPTLRGRALSRPVGDEPSASSSPSRSRLASVPAATKSSRYGIGRPHAGRQRLVALGAGQRVEPDEAVAVALEAGRLGGHERRIAAVPAVRYDDDDAARAQHAAGPLQVELAEAVADPGAAGPVGDGVGHLAQRGIAIALAEQPRDPGQPRPEHERLGADAVRGGQGLDEPQEEARLAFHRAADVAQDDDLARPSRRPAPDPVEGLAAVRQVAPEHRPRRDPAAPVVELLAARPARLEARRQQVDEALGVAQLGGRHPVELAMAEHLGRAVGIRRDDEPLDRLVVLALVRAGARRALEPAERLAVARPLHGRVTRLALVGLGRLRVRHRGRRQVVGERHPAAPETIEGLVVRLALVPPAHEHGRAGRPDLLLVAHVDERESAGEVDRGAEVDAQPDRAQGPPEDDRLAEKSSAVDVGIGPARPLSHPRRPPRGTRRPWRRGSVGRPPRT